MNMNNIDLKLSNSFKAIKKDMNGVKSQLSLNSRKIEEIDSIDKKSLNRILEKQEKDLLNLEKELYEVRKLAKDVKELKDFKKTAEKEFISKDDITKVKETKKKTKKEKVKETKTGKKGMFDKVIDFFAEKDD